MANDKPKSIPWNLEQDSELIQMGGMEVDETVVIPEWLNELNDEDALCRNYEAFEASGNDSVTIGICGKEQTRVGVPGGQRLRHNRMCIHWYRDWPPIFKGAVVWSYLAAMFVANFVVTALVVEPRYSPMAGWNIKGNTSGLVPILGNDPAHALRLLPATPSWARNQLGTLCVFFSAFYIVQVFGRYNQRFHDICRTNGGVTLVTCLCSSSLPRAEASAVIRYALAILHLYYYCIKGGLTRKEWRHLITMNLLTRREIAYLLDKPKQGAIVYAWAANVLNTSEKRGIINPNKVVRIEQNLGTDRGLAAKQIAYAITPVPAPFFHMTALSIHTWLIFVVWDTAINFASNYAAMWKGENFVAIMHLIGGVVLICVFVFLWRVAVTMSDPIGGSAYFHYDLNADLKGLCVEANAVLKAAFVDQPRSILKDRNDN